MHNLNMFCAENPLLNLGFPIKNDLLLKIACKSLIESKSWIQSFINFFQLAQVWYYLLELIDRIRLTD